MEKIQKFGGWCKNCKNEDAANCQSCKPDYDPRSMGLIPSQYLESGLSAKHRWEPVQASPESTLSGKSRSARLSFREAYRRAATQTEMQACTDSRKGMMAELCYIIAEVYMINMDSKIAVGGEPLDAYLVKDVFAELRYPHLEMVTDNFERETKYIKNKRAYLRTALYNSVFELEAHYTNLVKSDGAV